MLRLSSVRCSGSRWQGGIGHVERPHHDHIPVDCTPNRKQAERQAALATEARVEATEARDEVGVRGVLSEGLRERLKYWGCMHSARSGSGIVWHFRLMALAEQLTATELKLLLLYQMQLTYHKSRASSGRECRERSRACSAASVSLSCTTLTPSVPSIRISHSRSCLHLDPPIWISVG